jgi:hypothetical protein
VDGSEKRCSAEVPEQLEETEPHRVGRRANTPGARSGDHRGLPRHGYLRVNTASETATSWPLARYCTLPEYPDHLEVMCQPGRNRPDHQPHKK